jgi:hypothetical protein
MIYLPFGSTRFVVQRLEQDNMAPLLFFGLVSILNDLRGVHGLSLSTCLSHHPRASRRRRHHHHHHTQLAVSRERANVAPDKAATSATVTSRTLGEFVRIGIAGEEASSFLDSVGVPTFRCSGGVLDDTARAASSSATAARPVAKSECEDHEPTLCIDEVFTKLDCTDIIQSCEECGGFRSFSAGKNNHGALQLLVSKETANELAQRIEPYICLESVEARRRELVRSISRSSDSLEAINDGERCNHLSSNNDEAMRDMPPALVFAGLNRRWRVYKYAPNAMESFAPHIDAGFPPSGLTVDQDALVHDASADYASGIVSRLTILLYLNDDFVGGETNFYSPLAASRGSHEPVERIIAAVRPVAGSCLIFPQCVGPDAMDYARQYWPLHEGSPVQSGAPKYVIRSDILFHE